MLQYVLTDGKGNYLKRDAAGNYIPVSNINICDKWIRRDKANNVLTHCVNKNLRDRYKLISIEATENDTPLKSKKKSYKEMKVNDDALKEVGNLDIKDTSYDELIENIENLMLFATGNENKRVVLNNALSDVDKEISDINHCIEFGKFNAYEGWLCFKMLKNRLTQRRKIKDELYIIDQIGDCKINAEMLNDIKESIKAADTREYSPRKFDKLFEN